MQLPSAARSINGSLKRSEEWLSQTYVGNGWKRKVEIKLTGCLQEKSNLIVTQQIHFILTAIKNVYQAVFEI